MVKRWIVAAWVMVLAVAVTPWGGKAAEEKKAAPAEKVTVAVFRLGEPMVEQPMGEEIPFPLFSDTGVALKDVVGRIEKAAKDPAVKGVVLMMGPGAGLGMGQIEEVRQAVGKVRAAGKEVFAHSDSMGTGQYLLLSGASRLSMSPTSDLWLHGIFAEQPYIRGLLDKIGVTPEFLTCGDYKSAGEIVTRTGPSPEADRMTNWLLDGIFEAQLRLIARGRGVDEAKARQWVDQGPWTAEKAKEAGLIDAVEHRQEFDAAVKAKLGEQVAYDRRYGRAAQQEMDFSSPFAMFKIMGDLMGGGAKKKPSGKDAVAIVYVEGPIMEEPVDFNILSGSGPVAASSVIRKALDKAANDPSVKAVVLRVDSPGGSAVASEIILEGTKRVKAKKPLVVSMGNVAGSGGYYVACGAETIFADESTITGSIGVVTGKFITNPMWERVGITFKAYKRGENAGLLSSAAPFTDAERKRLQSWMDEIYGKFKGHVIAIRGAKLKKPIDELAGGRVYTGRQALELGLVDRIGTLADAIAHAAGEAKLAEGAYEVRVVPEPKNFFEALMGPEAQGKDEDARRIIRLGGHGDSLVEMALPHLRGMDPKRVEAVKGVLRRLEMMQGAGVMMLMVEPVPAN